jgi:D-lactate dehydrogenase (cytochrome)
MMTYHEDDMLAQRESHSPPTDGFMKELRSIFGARVDVGMSMRELHAASETHVEGTVPDAVVFAEETSEVAALMRLCSAHRVAVTPFGAGTSLEGNATPAAGGISLDLSRMDRILQVNAEDLDCVVQPGIRREQLNSHLRDRGLFFPVDPGANATIGGMVATRASGTNAVRYGTMRDAVLSLEVVLPSGEIIRTGRRARKSAAGYDLTHLMVGSEGTLGVVTEIALRLHGIPESIASAVCSFDTMEGAVATVVQTIQLGVPIARVEFLDPLQMRAINAYSKLDYPELTTLFFEFHGSDRYVEEQVETVGALSAENGGGAFRWSNRPEERSRLWKARHEAYYAALALRRGCAGWPTDVTVPISRLPECIAETRRDLDGSHLLAPILGHVGDGNFHVIFLLDPNDPADEAEARRLNDRLIGRAIAMGGTCTGEHGIGLGKQEWLVKELGGGVDVMRQIKRSLDPNNIMNPGKIFTL